MMTPNNYIDLADGRFKGTTPAQLKQLFAAVETSTDPNHLIIHFHGGLVSRSSAEQAADGLMPYYVNGKAYPVFFFWRSDLWTTLTANLDEIAKEDIFKQLVRRLLRLAVSALSADVGTRAAGVVPLKSLNEVPPDLLEMQAYAAAHEPAGVETVTVGDAFYEQAEISLRTDPALTAEAAAIAAGTLPKAASTAARAAGVNLAGKFTRLSPSVLSEIRREQSGLVQTRAAVGLVTIVRLAVVVLKNVLKRYAAGREHGLYTTIVEEVLRELYIDSLGALTWKMIKKDTLDAFGGDPLQHGGTAFVAELQNWWRPGRRITLVGHSTGAIYIGHFLERLDSALPEAARVSVAFLAPACTFAFLAERLPLFAARVDKLRLFGLHDAIERGYWEVPVIYPASLLYLVSGLCEPDEVDMPLLGMERYHSGTGPYARPDITQVVAYLGNNIVWSTTQGAPLGFNCAAKKHGQLDDDLDTRESLHAFLL